VGLGVTAVHPEEVGGKQSCFLSAGAGANLDDDVPIGARILRNEQRSNLGLECLSKRRQLFDLGLRQISDPRVGGFEERPRLGQLRLRLA
jgi:hypothetical protein